MIINRETRWSTLKEPIYARDQIIEKVFCGDTQVYPDDYEYIWNGVVWAPGYVVNQVIRQMAVACRDSIPDEYKNVENPIHIRGFYRATSVPADLQPFVGKRAWSGSGGDGESEGAISGSFIPVRSHGYNTTFAGKWVCGTDISDVSSTSGIFMWVEVDYIERGYVNNTGIVYWYCEKEYTFANKNASYMFSRPFKLQGDDFKFYDNGTGTWQPESSSSNLGYLSHTYIRLTDIKFERSVYATKLFYGLECPVSFGEQHPFRDVRVATSMFEGYQSGWFIPEFKDTYATYAEYCGYVLNLDMQSCEKANRMFQGGIFKSKVIFSEGSFSKTKTLSRAFYASRFNVDPMLKNISPKICEDFSYCLYGMYSNGYVEYSGISKDKTDDCFNLSSWDISGAKNLNSMCSGGQTNFEVLSGVKAPTYSSQRWFVVPNGHLTGDVDVDNMFRYDDTITSGTKVSNNRNTVDLSNLSFSGGTVKGWFIPKESLTSTAGSGTKFIFPNGDTSAKFTSIQYRCEILDMSNMCLCTGVTYDFYSRNNTSYGAGCVISPKSITEGSKIRFINPGSKAFKAAYGYDIGPVEYDILHLDKDGNELPPGEGSAYEMNVYNWTYKYAMAKMSDGLARTTVMTRVKGSKVPANAAGRTAPSIYVELNEKTPKMTPFYRRELSGVKFEYGTILGHSSYMYIPVGPVPKSISELWYYVPLGLGNDTDEVYKEYFFDQLGTLSAQPYVNNHLSGNIYNAEAWNYRFRI